MDAWTVRAGYKRGLDEKGGHGVVADLGSHIISIARHVVGPIVSLVGQIKTVEPETLLHHMRGHSV